MEFASYTIAQIVGGLVGILVTHAMFGLPLIQVSEKVRAGSNLWFSEFVATFGLISVIALAGRRRVEMVPATVAAYITSAYWFTSSTSFANPVVTLARTWTNTFCGIASPGLIPFIIAQTLGALAAFVLLHKLPTKAD